MFKYSKTQAGFPAGEVCRLLSVIALPSLMLFLGTPGQAQTSSWNGSKADFSTSADWSAGVPTATTSLSITSGTATYSNTSTYLYRAATTTISGTGTLTITNNRFVNGYNGTGVVNVSGNGTLNQTGQYFVVANAGTGTFNQSGGTVNSTVSAGWFLSDNAGSAGSYSLTGGSLNVSASGAFATNSNYGVHFGKNSGTDVFDVNGGTANFKATAADVRTYVSQGAKLEVDSGSATFNGFRYFTIGRNSGDGKTSQVVVNGGLFAITNLSTASGVNGVSVGNGNAGQITLNGGEMEVTGTASSGAGLFLGDNSTGTVIQNGGLMSLNVDVILSRAANSQGIYDMYGGELDALNITTGAGVNPIFNFQGGDIYLTGDQTSILAQSWFEDAPGTVAVFDATEDKTHIYVTPEPNVALLLAAGLGAIMLIRRRMTRNV